MNRELFRSMQGQMQPSEEAREALAEKLASGKKRPVPVGRYVAAAACAAVLVAAIPVYRIIQDRYKWWTLLNGFDSDCYVETLQPHSYVLADEAACWPTDAGAPEHNTVAGGGDVDADLASGWQMTWAKWWKFYHMAEESGDWTLEALLDFSRNEMLAVSTGEAPVEIPGGAYVGDLPDQSEAVMAYQNLMARFEADYGPDRYPEWYGGAYIDEHAGLIVNIAADYEPEDKELYFQIWNWAGSERVAFGSSELPMNRLKELQGEVIAVMEELGLQFGCGIDEEAGQVELTLPEATTNALWALARLDPADTAIRVMVGQMTDMGDLTEEPMSPSVSHNIQPGGSSVDPNTPVTYIPGVGEVTDPDWKPREPWEDGPWQTEPSEGGTSPGVSVDDAPGIIVDADGVIAYEPDGSQQN